MEGGKQKGKDDVGYEGNDDNEEEEEGTTIIITPKVVHVFLNLEGCRSVLVFNKGDIKLIKQHETMKIFESYLKQSSSNSPYTYYNYSRVKKKEDLKLLF